MSKKCVISLISSILLCLSFSTLAKEPIIRSIGEVDRQFMSKQISNIDDLSRRYLGRQIHGTKHNDLEVMQLLLDRRIVKAKDRMQLQAMGVILGNLISQAEKIEWVVYIDEYGRSKALEVPNKDEVIFPITMISRRAEVGIDVDVEAIYELAIDEIERIRRKIIIR